MRLLDSRGRFLGKIHLVDLLGVFFLLGLSPLFFFAREVVRERDPAIIEVAPTRVVPGSRIRLRGRNFRWTHEVFVGEQRAVHQQYYGTDAIVAYVPLDLAPGRYPVRLEWATGAAARWAGDLEVTPSADWVDEPVVVRFRFRYLTPEERRICRESVKPSLGPITAERIRSEPQILSIWQEGREEALPDPDGRNAGPGSWLLAEVGLVAQVQPSAEHPVYYYDGQPLNDLLPVRLKMAGRAWETTVDWPPEPLLLRSVDRGSSG